MAGTGLFPVTSVSQNDGFSPVPLRPWYISSVLIYILLLLAMLEYSLHTVPQIGTRQTSPPERLYKSLPHNEGPAATRRGGFLRRSSTTNATNNFENFPPFNGTGSCNTTLSENISTTGNCSGEDPENDIGPIKAFHLDPNAFARLDPDHYIVHFRWNMVWVHDETAREKIQVPPGVDISTRCVMYNADIVLTDNPDDCQVLIQVFEYDEWEGAWFIYDIGEPLTSCPLQQAEFARSYGMGEVDIYIRPEPPLTEEDYYGCWNAEADAQTTFNFPNRVLSWPEIPTVSASPTGTALTKPVITTAPAPTTTTTPRGAVTVGGVVMTLTNSLAQPTATLTEVAIQFPVDQEQAGLPDPDAPLIHTTVVNNFIAHDINGQPVETQPVTFANVVVINPTVTNIATTHLTVFDPENGRPTATRTRYIIPSSLAPSPPSRLPTPRSFNTSNFVPPSAVRVNPLTWQAYFAGSFAPVVLATILSILVQVLSNSARATVPFILLSKSKHQGIPAEDTLLLNINASNILRLDQAFRLAWRYNEPLLLLCAVLQVFGMVLVALSSEAIGMTLGGGCNDDNFFGCYMSLAIVKGPARAVEVILASMAVIVLAVLVSTRREFFEGLITSCKRWRIEDGNADRERSGIGKRSLSLCPGVRQDPTSIFGSMVLIAGENSRQVRELLVSRVIKNDQAMESLQRRTVKESAMEEWFEGKRFELNKEGEIVLASNHQEHYKAEVSRTTTEESEKGKDMFMARSNGTWRSIKSFHEGLTTHHRTTVILDYGLRILFLLVLGSLLFIVSYYGSRQLWFDDPLERFMDSQTFGTSFVFTGAGSIIDLFWGGFFSQLELLEPYRALSQTKDAPSSSSSFASSDSRTSPSAKNIFRPARSSSTISGLFRALTNHNFFLGLVALTGFFSQFLSILFANIPFRLTLTWTTFVVCTWISAGVLGLMILVLLLSFVARKPYYMPVDPGTMAGRMYYVCDSWATRELSGFGELDGEAREEKVKEMKRAAYGFGNIVGVSGRERIGIDVVFGIGKGV
ncbi:hypothetical protein V8F20_010889 [Naviculisporaceae sp. PSN 640]